VDPTHALPVADPLRATQDRAAGIEPTAPRSASDAGPGSELLAMPRLSTCAPDSWAQARMGESDPHAPTCGPVVLVDGERPRNDVRGARTRVVPGSHCGPVPPSTVCSVSANGDQDVAEDSATPPGAPARALKVEPPLEALAGNERHRLFDAFLEEFTERVAEKLATKIARTGADASFGSGRLEANLDVKQAARMLGISPRTLYPLAEKGEVPSIKVGGRRLFRPAELKAYLDKQAPEAKKSSATGATSIRRISRLIR